MSCFYIRAETIGRFGYAGEGRGEKNTAPSEKNRKEKSIRVLVEVCLVFVCVGGEEICTYERVC